jgi:hypothetical protein
LLLAHVENQLNRKSRERERLMVVLVSCEKMETLGFDFGIFGAGWGKKRGEGGEGGGLSLGLG